MRTQGMCTCTCVPTHMQICIHHMHACHSPQICLKFYILSMKEKHSSEESTDLAFERTSCTSWVSFYKNSLGKTAVLWPAVGRAELKERLNQMDRCWCLIIDSPHLVFCSLSLPGILMMLFRISLPILNLHILDDLIQNNVLDTNSPTFFPNTGFIGI